MLLALDTSTGRAGIALHGESGPVASLSWQSGRMHTEQLLPFVDDLCRRVSVEPGDLRAVAVATGPGSFSGVRVGLATAKGICGALGVPIIGVPTLLYTAWPHRFSGLPIRAVLPLGRDRLAVAAYQPDAAYRLTLQSLRNLSVEDAASPEHALYCGEIPAELRRILEESSEPVVPEDAVAERKVEILAGLGWERLLRRQTDLPSGLQAVYLERG